jgi:eukaryotic-like serine/threonine-protein kinase
VTLAAGTRLGSYEVVAPLGAGGMGEVYRARDVRLGREVALKVLPAEVSGDRDRLARFEQEARSASALNHPNIVTVYEVGESGETSFIAMELVEGRTLRELCAAGPMPIRRILAVAAQAAEGLAKAHSAGIVHRDLKPENLMVSKDGFVKILDFGLSKLVAPESGEVSAMPTVAKAETEPGTVLGTVAYMSPEQASGQAVDYRSDQFSLGSILHEALTGEKTFAHNTAAETMAAIIRDEPAPVSQLRPETPPPLRWIVERCLAKDPEERYTSTRDLARDLAAVRDRISEITSGAEAPSIARGRGRFALRSGALPAAAALLAAGILAGWVAAGGLRQDPSAPTFHRLSFRPGQIGNARFAPDGQTVIYGATYEGETVTRSLYQTRPESPESRRFEFSDADILSIAPSGEMAVVLGVSTRRTVLARVPLSGGVPREVLEGVGYGNADWSPDGKNFAVVRQTEGRFRLEYPIGKTLFETSGRIDSPRFSPSGEEIAFFQAEGAKTSVVVVRASGGSRRVLSGGWVEAYGVPGWSPDGREVWFTAVSPGSHAALYAVNRSGRQRLVTRVPGDLELDDISRDGRALVAHHSHFVTLMGVAPGESKERDLAWLDESVPVDISSDGRKLVVAEQGEGGGANSAVYLRPTDGSPPVRLGDGAPATLSPDGSWVVARTGFGQGEKPQLVLLPTGAGEARLLADEGLADITWANWLPDGRNLVLAASEPGRRPRLYVQNIAGGKPRPISPEGFRLRQHGNSVSPDGKLVAALGRNNQPVLCPVDGGEPRPIAGLMPGETPIQWTADGASLYVHRRGGIPVKVFLFDLATGQKRPWKEIRPSDPLARGIAKLLVTPDGSAYAYQTDRVTSELYVVEGLR